MPIEIQDPFAKLEGVCHHQDPIDPFVKLEGVNRLRFA
jgi:hypothetical protein